MTITPNARRPVFWLTFASLALMLALGAACSGSDDSDTADVSQQSGHQQSEAVPDDTGDETTPTETDAPETAEPEPIEEPIPTPAPATSMFGSFDQVIELRTDASGGGARPTLEWSAVDGTDHYGVYLYAPDGAVYWAWRGYETSVPVGGQPLLAETSAGPSVVDGMTWAVVAFDADLRPIAVSPLADISP